MVEVKINTGRAIRFVERMVIERMQLGGCNCDKLVGILPSLYEGVYPEDMGTWEDYKFVYDYGVSFISQIMEV